jgi:hypothetical protein
MPKPGRHLRSSSLPAELEGSDDLMKWARDPIRPAVFSPVFRTAEARERFGCLLLERQYMYGPIIS